MSEKYDMSPIIELMEKAIKKLNQITTKAMNENDMLNREIRLNDRPPEDDCPITNEVIFDSTLYDENSKEYIVSVHATDTFYDVEDSFTIRNIDKVYYQNADIYPLIQQWIGADELTPNDKQSK